MLCSVGRWEAVVVVQSMLAWLGTVLPAAMAQPTEEEPDFTIWWGVFIALLVGPVAIYSVKFIADRRRDRRTKELITDSNKDGPVPELPPDFEPPQVVPRKTKPLAGRWKRL